MKKIVLLIVICSLPLFLLGFEAFKPRACRLVSSQGPDMVRYQRFEEGLEDDYTLRTELFGIRTQMYNYEQRGNDTCPRTLEMLEVRTRFSTVDGSYTILYDRLNDNEYKLGVRNSQGSYYLAFVE